MDFEVLEHKTTLRLELTAKSTLQYAGQYGASDLKSSTVSSNTARSSDLKKGSTGGPRVGRNSWAAPSIIWNLKIFFCNRKKARKS